MARKKRNFRNNENRSPQPKIIGEGITESYYFKHLKEIKNYKCKVDFKILKNDDTIYNSKKINKLIEEGVTVILIFDTDIAANDETVKKQINDFKEKCKNKENVLICDSFPCIEFWFLLHFTNKTGFNNCDNAETKLKEYIKSFSKTEKFLENQNWVEKYLCPNMKDAIKKAKTINKGIEKQTNNKNSSTQNYSNIYLAIEKLEKNNS